MEKITMGKYEARTTIFKAIAHPARLLIIDALSKQRHCVCELTEMVGADTSTVSKHLSILKNAGIVEIEKKSQMVYYSISMPCILNFMSCVDKALQERAKAQLALVE